MKANKSDLIVVASAKAKPGHAKKFSEYIGQLLKEGKLKSAQPLEMNGRIISGKNGLVKDGPFNESKEVIGVIFSSLQKIWMKPLK